MASRQKGASTAEGDLCVGRAAYLALRAGVRRARRDKGIRRSSSGSACRSGGGTNRSRGGRRSTTRALSRSVAPIRAWSMAIGTSPRPGSGSAMVTDPSTIGAGRSEARRASVDRSGRRADPPAGRAVMDAEMAHDRAMGLRRRSVGHRRPRGGYGYSPQRAEDRPVGQCEAYRERLATSRRPDERGSGAHARRSEAPRDRQVVKLTIGGAPHEAIQRAFAFGGGARGRWGGRHGASSCRPSDLDARAGVRALVDDSRGG